MRSRSHAQKRTASTVAKQNFNMTFKSVCRNEAYAFLTKKYTHLKGRKYEILFGTFNLPHFLFFCKKRNKFFAIIVFFSTIVKIITIK